MHIHILGICGTFMGGVARLARDAGHVVTGSDANIYPPMSTQLESLGIDVLDIEDLSQFDQDIDMVVVGNAMSRGYVAVEQMLNLGLPYTSGPEWLAENVLHKKHVLAVAGTHGKTTTSSMLAWILEDNGMQPGFLIGGVAQDFGESARLGGGNYFVVEADEYDTAYFDKRSKFIHYRPMTLVLNNLEFDHADIFDDLDQIKKQFHHLIRTVPGIGCIIVNGADQNLADVLRAGCWTPLQTFDVNSINHLKSVGQTENSDWMADSQAVTYDGATYTMAPLCMPGLHNLANALAAIAAAHRVGVDVQRAIDSLSRFKGVARRLQLRGEVEGRRIYDDFAHHPTAIAATLSAVKEVVDRGRVIAILEPRSNTMRSTVHEHTLAASLQAADQVWLFQPDDLKWQPRKIAEQLSDAHIENDVEMLLDKVSRELLPHDHVVIMSNGGFGQIHARLLDRLAQIYQQR